ncbi:hypothetical protein AB0392_12305 [Nonomuraea angiospora]|uniref:hypothetical protein n=1 Tax=Nonomuraea angiospora TaxID=46172 RepID=UPI00344E7DD0
MARRKENDDLSAVESLNIALQTLTLFHGYVQHADAKLAAAATVHLGFTAVAATQIDGLVKAWTSGPLLATVAVTLVMCFTAGFFLSGHHLISALRPHLTGPTGPNRFGLVQTAAAPSTADAAEQQREAWSLISTLSDIAIRKHERIRRSLTWMILMLMAIVAWIALAALTS